MDRYKQRLIDRLNRERLEAAQQQPHANLFAEGGNAKMNNYINNVLMPWIVNGGDIWADTPRNAQVRQYLYQNGASAVLQDIYDNYTDDKRRGSIDKRFIPSSVAEQSVKKAVSDSIDTKSAVSEVKKAIWNPEESLDSGLVGMIPYIGDALSAGQVARDARDGNYLNAALGAGMLLLPNVLEKPLKGIKNVAKYVKDINSSDVQKSLYKRAIENNNAYYKYQNGIGRNIGISDSIDPNNLTNVEFGIVINPLTLKRSNGRYNSKTNTIRINPYRKNWLKNAYDSPDDLLSMVAGTIAHEDTHRRMYLMPDSNVSRLSIPSPNYKRTALGLKKHEYRIPNINNNVLSKTELDELKNAFLPYKGAWKGSPEEFQAELRKIATINNLPNTTVFDYNPQDFDLTLGFMSKRFDMSQENALRMMQIMQFNGYGNGGKA